MPCNRVRRPISNQNPRDRHLGREKSTSRSIVAKDLFLSYTLSKVSRFVLALLSPCNPDFMVARGRKDGLFVNYQQISQHLTNSSAPKQYLETLRKKVGMTRSEECCRRSYEVEFVTNEGPGRKILARDGGIFGERERTDATNKNGWANIWTRRTIFL